MKVSVRLELSESELQQSLANHQFTKDVINLIMSERRLCSTIAEREMLTRLAKAVEKL